MARIRKSVTCLLCILGMILSTSIAGADKSYAPAPPLDKSDPCPVVTQASEHAHPCLCRECERRWELIIMPYGWATSLKGSLSVENATADVDVSFSKIWDHLDCAAFGQVELTNGRWMLISDTVWAKLGADVSVDKSRDILFGEGQAFLNVDANLEMTMLIQELIAGYRICEKNLECPDACGAGRKVALDLLFGGRYYKLDSTVDAEAKLLVEGPGGGQIRKKKSASVSETIDWTDAVVGGRLSYDVTRNLALSLRGDVGGFDGKDDSSWSVAALAQWRIRKHLTLLGGYKVENFKYSHGEGALDLRMRGPIAGLMWKCSF